MMSVLRLLRRRVLIHRRLLAALFAFVAVYAALRALTPAEAPTRQVLVAATDLPAGTRLAAKDLTTIGALPDALPAAAVTEAPRLVGRTLAVPVRSGEVITDVRLLGRALQSAYPGLVATPVRLSDASVVALLKPGDVVDVIAGDPQGRQPPRVLATAARVLAVPPEPRGFAASPDGALTLLAVRPEESALAAAAPVAGYVTVVWSR